MSKEFSIGALRARDNFEMSRSDIVVKMVERMEIYAVACEEMARNESVRPELRNKLVQHLYACFCELSDFLINVITLLRAGLFQQSYSIGFIWAKQYWHLSYHATKSSMRTEQVKNSTKGDKNVYNKHMGRGIQLLYTGRGIRPDDSHCHC